MSAFGPSLTNSSRLHRCRTSTLHARPNGRAPWSSLNSQVLLSESFVRPVSVKLRTEHPAHILSARLPIAFRKVAEWQPDHQPMGQDGGGGRDPRGADYAARDAHGQLREAVALRQQAHQRLVGHQLRQRVSTACLLIPLVDRRFAQDVLTNPAHPIAHARTQPRAHPSQQGAQRQPGVAQPALQPDQHHARLKAYNFPIHMPRFPADSPLIARLSILRKRLIHRCKRPRTRRPALPFRTL